MLLGEGYNVLIISLSDIFSELTIAKNVLNKWNKRYSKDKEKFFFLDAGSGQPRSEQNSEEADLMIVIFKKHLDDRRIDDNIIKYLEAKIKKRIDSNKKASIYFAKESTGLTESFALSFSNIKEYFKSEKIPYREYLKEEFEFNITCDINDFIDFAKTTEKDQEGKNIPQRTTFISRGEVNIEIQEPTTDNQEFYEVKYSFSVIADSQKKPVEYKDRVVAIHGITSYNFRPEAIILNQEQYSRNKNYLEYKLLAPDKKSDLFFTGEILVKQDFSGNECGIGFHIPYFAKNLTVSIKAPDNMKKDIRNCKITLIHHGGNNENVKGNFNENTGIYTLIIFNASEDSNIVVKWDNK